MFWLIGIALAILAAWLFVCAFAASMSDGPPPAWGAWAGYGFIAAAIGAVASFGVAIYRLFV